MLPLVAGMAGAGLAKNILFDQPAAEKNRQMQAAIAQYSPWTGMRPDMSNLQAPSPLASAMQGGMTGAQLGQAAEQHEAYKNFLDKMSPQEMTPTVAQGMAPNMSVGMPARGQFNPYLTMGG